MRRRILVTAREIGPDDADYERLWKGVNKLTRGQYDAYQSKTERRIPLVILTPR